MPGMELVLSVVAILVAVVALVLVLSLRNQLAQLPRADSGADLERLRRDSSAEVERLRQELGDIRRDLDRGQGELEQLKAATQIVPAPPLPRARSAGLNDLREQLRAAHREPEPGSEE
jgi:uncharacterized membrane protein